MYKVAEFNVKLVLLAITNGRDNCPLANDGSAVLPFGATNDVVPEPAIVPLLHISVPLTSSGPAPLMVPPLRPGVFAVEGLTASVSVNWPPEMFSVPPSWRVAMLVVPPVKLTAAPSEPSLSQIPAPAKPVAANDSATTAT